MAYLLLITEPKGQRETRSLLEGQALYEQMLQFTEDLKTRGVHLASASLKSDSEAVRLTLHEGKRSLIDGPFAEAKEMIGGFFLLDCDKREEAIAIASECPAAAWATVEVRETGPCYL